MEKLKNIPHLATDLFNNVTLKALVSRYNELLPTAALTDLITLCNGNSISQNIEIVKRKVEETPTTAEVVSRLKESDKKYKNVHLVDYPHTDGMMAHQLNYVRETLNSMKLINTVASQTYFAVYNADSLPDEKTINEIINKIQIHNFPFALQQYSCCLSNWNRISNLMKGFAIFQSNFELKFGLINAALPSRFLYSYVVGHGMFLRLDKLNEVNGFETDFWCEDIYMSCVFRNENINIQPIYVLEKMEVPQFFSTLASTFKNS